MTKNEFILIISKIETEFPIHKLKYKNEKVWPLFRLILVELLISKKNIPILGISETLKLHYLVRLFLKGVASKIISRLGNNNKERADFVYFGKPDERRKTVEGKKFNTFGNSLGYYCNRMSPPVSFKLLELLNKNINKNEVFGEAYFLNAEFKGLYNEKYKKAFLIYISSQRVSFWKEFITYLHKLGIDLNYSEKAFIERVEKILSIKSIFEKRLKFLKAKVLFCGYFFHDIGFALSLAGRSLNIKTVEIQHGQQGDNNIVYTNWNNYPTDGYNMIPNVFWMWSAKNTRRINKWIGNSTVHKAVVGGNTWLSYNLNNIEHSIKKPAELKNKKNIVLICMQNIDLPDFMYEAIKESPEIYWMIRFHPAFPEINQTIQEKINTLDLPNFDIEIANSIELYQLYKLVDIQITFWSTVAYEALIFDIPTILIHENGKNGMKDYIREQIFFYSENTKEILDLILKREQYFKKESERFIEFDENIITKQLSELLP